MEVMNCKVKVLVVVLLLFSCESQEKRGRGEVIISSKFDFESYSVMGYNFELGKSTSFPSSGNPLPDILVDQFRLIDGSVKPGFTSPDNSDGFWKAGEFGTRSESMDFFQNELKAVDPSVEFTPSTDTVKLYQVYVLKTTSGNYAKIHVSEIWEVDDVAGKYIDVKIDYHYKSDGGTSFSD